MNELTPREGAEPSQRKRDPEVEKLLQEGISAARSGDAQRARDRLLQVLGQDPSCVRAWLWLSDVLERPGEKALCLEQVIRIEPDHVAARYGLSSLQRERGAQEEH
jgi:Tfp pilus assembly protein PilF